MTLIPAGFWRRLAAIFIDSLILGFAIQIPMQFIMMYFFMSAVGSAHGGSGGFPVGLFSGMFKGIGIMCAIFCGAYIAYYVLFLSSRWQATPGKRIMGVYITTASFGRLTIARAFVRWMAFTGPMLVVWVLQFTSMPDMFSKMMPPEMMQILQRTADIQQKKAHGQPLTNDEQAFLDNEQNRRQHWQEINEKRRNHIPLSEEDKMFRAQDGQLSAEQMKSMAAGFTSPAFVLMMIFGAIGQLYILAMAVTVAFTEKKTGIHDMMCGTRALKGRT